mgnify:FL=1
MTKHAGYFYFGTITKAHGLKGEMVVKNLMEDAEILNDFEAIFVEINQQLSPYFLRSLVFRKKGEALIGLEDVNSIEATAILDKKDIYLPEDLLPELDEDSIRYKDLIGYEVKDEFFGVVGKIKNVLVYPQQEILEIDHKGRDVLIPATEDFIIEIDTEKKLVITSVPEGLIEIYLSDKHQQEE